MTPSKILKVVNFSCGCMAEYPILGEFSDKQEWHIVSACREHRGDIKQIERTSEETFQSSLVLTPN